MNLALIGNGIREKMGENLGIGGGLGGLEGWGGMGC